MSRVWDNYGFEATGKKPMHSHKISAKVQRKTSDEWSRVISNLRRSGTLARDKQLKVLVRRGIPDELRGEVDFV